MLIAVLPQQSMPPGAQRQTRSSGVRPANDGTDGQTDRRTPDRYIDPASGFREKLKWETLRAEPITPGVLTISVNMRQ